MLCRLDALDQAAFVLRAIEQFSLEVSSFRHS